MTRDALDTSKGTCRSVVVNDMQMPDVMITGDGLAVGVDALVGGKGLA